MRQARHDDPVIECGFCQRRYRSSEATLSGCSACPRSADACGKVRCPHCLYDNPLPGTGLLARLLGFKNR
jgi:predicted amidophosphoribosyltransferase